jgi:hypothetical protein
MDDEALLALADSLAPSNEALKRQHVVLKKQVAGFATPLSSPQPTASPSQPPDTKPTLTRYLDRDIRVYHVSRGVEGPLEPVATYRIESTSETPCADHTVSSNLRWAAYTTRNSVVCIDQESDMLWSSALEPHSTQLWGHYPSCASFLDGTKLWIYRPDAMAGRRGHDMLVVLHADTGDLLAEAKLDTVGHRAELLQHPDGQHVLVCIGEGQDGAKMFRAALTDDGINLYSYGWTDRCLVDLASDGRRFMTVDHGRNDVAFHRFPDGEVMLRLPVTAFGYQEYESFVDWSGGFLNPDVAIITVMGETDGREWRHYHRVDLHTGSPQGRFEPNSRDGCDFELLGDGTWVISRVGGDPVRFHDS